MKIAIAQLNCIVGDLEGNINKILEAYQQSQEAGAELLITPELALCGYPPQDWLLREDFIHACQRALVSLTARIHDAMLIVGHPHFANGKLFNAASIIQTGRIHATYCKNHLLTGGSLDERQYFEPGSQPCVFELKGTTFGLAICSDCQHLSHLQAVRQTNPQVLLSLNASPYRLDKQEERHQIIRDGIAQTGMPVIYVNQVGGQDELVFDGASFAMNSAGEIVYQLEAFQETLGFVEIEAGQPKSDKCCPLPDRMTGLYSALCLGMRDFVVKNGFPGVLIGLSGGIDSALVLAIAVDALGPEKVRTVMMPSPYTADISIQDAREMARNLGVQHTEIPIDSIFENFLETLRAEFQNAPAVGNPSTTENLQARIRGVLLMALANQFGLLVLATGNKSEVAVGYSTLYGDMVGGFSVLKDVSKTLVYQLSYHRNQITPIIPERVQQRPPSAELRPGQTDQDSLPAYDRLDAIIAAHVENGRSLNDIVSMNYPEEEVRQVLRLIHSSEYKRRQAAPGIRITRRDFGKSWNFPLTSKFLK